MNTSSALIKRFGLLSFIQFINFIFPLAIYFLLISRINIQQIGEISSWQMIFFILATLSNYNFPLTLIPINEKLRNSPKTVASLWNKILELRFSLLFFLIIIVVLLFPVLPKIALLSSLLFIGKLFNPIPLLSVLTKNNLVLRYSFFIKIIPLILIYLLIDKTSWQWTNFIIGISEFVVSVFFIIYLKWNVFFKFLGFKKMFIYLEKERKAFYIQSTSSLIIFSTIPLTHLFFGSYTAGILSIIEKMVSVIRAISGNLFYALLPNFDCFKIDNSNKTIKKIHIKSFFLALFTFIAILFLILTFKDFIQQKVIDKSILWYLIISSLVCFPVIMSSPYQMICFKLNKTSKIFLYSKLQLAFLIVGLFVFGKLAGIYGIIGSIIVHELICYYMYKNEF